MLYRVKQGNIGLYIGLYKDNGRKKWKLLNRPDLGVKSAHQ